jgi:transcriptional regulator with XRE-family HTH domain
LGFSVARFPAHERRIVRIISTAREGQGLSARELSVKLGEAPSYIGRIERLQRKVGLAEFAKIAKTLKRDPVELFGETLFG